MIIGVQLRRVVDEPRVELLPPGFVLRESTGAVLTEPDRKRRQAANR
jgi:hypothetical protein